MKKTITLLCISFLFTVSLCAQDIRYEVKVKYNRDASGTAADISVSVTSGEAPFIYTLMTNDPIHGEILLRSEPSRDVPYTFKGVRPGKYFMKIEDSTGKQAGKTVTIVENENSL